MQINQGVVQEMRDEVMQAVAAIAARHGLDVVQQKNVTYRDTDFSIKYTFSDASVDLNRIEFETKCWQFGLQASHYMKEFYVNGEKFQITGVSTRAPKYPIKYLKDDKPMKCGVDFMKVLLSKSGT